MRRLLGLVCATAIVIPTLASCGATAPPPVKEPVGNASPATTASAAANGCESPPCAELSAPASSEPCDCIAPAGATNVCKGACN